MNILTDTESKEVTPLTPGELMKLVLPMSESMYLTVKLLVKERDDWQALCAATGSDLEAMRRARDEMTQSRDHWQAIAARRIANLEHYTRLSENDIAELTRERDALAADAARYRYLRDRNRDDVLLKRGPSAGVWCDCEDEEGSLILLTGDDLDTAIDVWLPDKDRRSDIVLKERDEARQEAINMACAAGDYQRERDALAALLQEVVDNGLNAPLEDRIADAIAAKGE